MKKLFPPSKSSFTFNLARRYFFVEKRIKVGLTFSDIILINFLVFTKSLLVEIHSTGKLNLKQQTIRSPHNCVPLPQAVH